MPLVAVVVLLLSLVADVPLLLSLLTFIGVRGLGTTFSPYFVAIHHALVDLLLSPRVLVGFLHSGPAGRHQGPGDRHMAPIKVQL